MTAYNYILVCMVDLSLVFLSEKKTSCIKFHDQIARLVR